MVLPVELRLCHKMLVRYSDLPFELCSGSTPVEFLWSSELFFDIHVTDEASKFQDDPSKHVAVQDLAVPHLSGFVP
jgi:hypothetical protein